jgi:hypothetical protein
MDGCIFKGWRLPSELLIVTLFNITFWVYLDNIFQGGYMRLDQNILGPKEMGKEPPMILS